MKLKAIVTFTATAEVEFEVPDSAFVRGAAAGPGWEWAAMQDAVRLHIKRRGLPEVLKNPTIELVDWSSIEANGRIAEGRFVQDGEATDSILLATD